MSRKRRLDQAWLEREDLDARLEKALSLLRAIPCTANLPAPLARRIAALVLAERSIRQKRLEPQSVQRVGSKGVRTLLWTVLGIRSLFQTRRELALENLALRQQIGVLLRTQGGRRLRLGVWDRAFWVILSRRWGRWRELLAIVEPATVIRVASNSVQGVLEAKESTGTHGAPWPEGEVVALIRVTAPRSPWQNPYAERLIGSLRRDCPDHVIVLDEMHLMRILAKYFRYYNRTRCHLSLAGDAPEGRLVHGPG